MNAGRESNPPSILLPFQPCTVLTFFVKIAESLVAVEMNSNDDLYKRNQFPVPALGQTIIYPRACTSCLYTTCSVQDEPPHVCPASPPFVSLIEKNERFAWVLQPGWELGNAILFHLFQVAGTRLLDLREKKSIYCPSPEGENYIYICVYIFTHPHSHIWISSVAS